MKTLAIDSSLAAGSVAALSAGRVVEQLLPVTGEHARRLVAALDAAARSLGWTTAAAELVGVVRGPGSFTGLRVGVATAQAIAWATGARLVGVSGFEVVARQSALHGGGTTGDIHVAYDAGRGELYVATVAAVPDAPGGWQAGAARITDVASWLEHLPRCSRVSGPALGAIADRLALRGDLVIAPSTAWLPTAAAVGSLALELAAAGRADAPHALLPLYLRPSYADEAEGRSSR